MAMYFILKTRDEHEGCLNFKSYMVMILIIIAVNIIGVYYLLG